MTAGPMEGIRVVEVAQYTFVPAAGAVLADWGADVIKVEHAVRGDAQRGLRLGTGGAAEGSFQPLMEHPNRGKRSVGLALETPEGRQVLDRLLADADVFLTNFLPGAIEKLDLGVEAIRAISPGIIYARGSAFGPTGPESRDGGFDLSAFWCRAGSAYGATPIGATRVADMPSGAYGDTMGGMTIAGGVAAALLKRERTGEPSVIDVSLLSVGAWANALSITTAMMTGESPARSHLDDPPHRPSNPIVGAFPTSDGRFINLTMLQAGRYWADLCDHIDRPDLAQDPRFADAADLMGNAAAAGEEVAAAIAARPLHHWIDRFQTLQGQWAVVQSPLEVAADPQVVANVYVLPVIDADGTARHLVANPVQFDQAPPPLTRGPQFAEHTDQVVRELGYDDEGLIALKVAGAIT